MPVSTRSQILGSNGKDQEQAQLSSYALRNPHHGLKEKLKSLTLFYEQHKLASGAPSGIRDLDYPQNPNLDAQEAQFKRENLSSDLNLVQNSNSNSNSIPNVTVAKTYLRPPQPPPPNPPLPDDAKENFGAINGGDRIVGFSCPRKQPPSTTVARKLSLGSQLDHRTVTQIQDPDSVTMYRTRKDDNNRIMVFVRLRPMMRKEKDSGARNCVKIANQRDVYLTEFASENDYLRLKRLRGRHFTFDGSFSESSTQQEVYSATTAELVEAVLEGRNGSVFCYGATGAGKTYTMLGTVENPGVMVLAIKDLFAKIRQRSIDGNHVVHLSYLEVYNETVRDLLSPGRPLVLREDKQGIVAAGLTQYQAYSTDEVMALLLQGNKNRTTEPTRVNETSSRSHAILQVMIEYRTRDASMNTVNRVGKLSLIDLAGSERALATDQRTVRSIEGANINRSLLALSSCINALVEGKRHIPYRNSKLTQLLKDSLGGACNTVMIANISPSSMSFGETQNTLHWADRAKEIRIKTYERNEELVPENVADQAKLLLEVQKENRELRVQLAKQQQKLVSLQAQTLAANSTSPAPSSVSSFLSPPLSSSKAGKQRPRPSLLPRNCETPEPRKLKVADETIRELQQAVRMLEAEMKRMKKDHAVQLKKKDEIIQELSNKANAASKRSSMRVGEEEGVKYLVTRASLRPKNNQTNNNAELKTPRHRFQSPVPTAKKRSFWDITTANSPSVTSVNGRKTKSHVAHEAIAPPSTAISTAIAPPSMLLQLAYPCLWFVLMLAPHLANIII